MSTAQKPSEFEAIGLVIPWMGLLIDLTTPVCNNMHMYLSYKVTVRVQIQNKM